MAHAPYEGVPSIAPPTLVARRERLAFQGSLLLSSSPLSRLVAGANPAAIVPLCCKGSRQKRLGGSRLRSQADTAAKLFYGRLFELDPSLRRLFHSDNGVGSLAYRDAVGQNAQHSGRIDEISRPEKPKTDLRRHALLWCVQMTTAQANQAHHPRRQVQKAADKCH
jgi:hypothetical protein